MCAVHSPGISRGRLCRRSLTRGASVVSPALAAQTAASTQSASASPSATASETGSATAVGSLRSLQQALVGVCGACAPNVCPPVQPAVESVPSLLYVIACRPPPHRRAVHRPSRQAATPAAQAPLPRRSVAPAPCLMMAAVNGPIRVMPANASDHSHALLGTHPLCGSAGPPTCRAVPHAVRRKLPHISRPLRPSLCPRGVQSPAVSSTATSSQTSSSSGTASSSSVRLSELPVAGASDCVSEPPASLGEATLHSPPAPLHFLVCSQPRAPPAVAPALTRAARAWLPVQALQLHRRRQCLARQSPGCVRTSARVRCCALASGSCCGHARTMLCIAIVGTFPPHELRGTV